MKLTQIEDIYVLNAANFNNKIYKRLSKQRLRLIIAKPVVSDELQIPEFTFSRHLWSFVVVFLLSCGHLHRLTSNHSQTHVTITGTMMQMNETHADSGILSSSFPICTK